MQARPVFPDILKPSDDELARVLGAGVVEHETLHEWPLSCVQRLPLDEGSGLVYQAQRPPTVEPLLYERAPSPLLPGHRSLGRLGECAVTKIAWIASPLLRNTAP